MSDLPQGWAEIQFTDIFDIKGGTQPPKSEFAQTPKPGYIRLLQIRDFGSDAKAVYIPDAERWSTCDADDIMIGRYGASIGKILTGKAGAYNVALVKMIFDKSKIDARWVFSLLQSEHFQRPIALLSRSAQNGFNKEDLASIPISLPPLPEQRRIVAKVDGLSARTARARKELDRIPTLIARYKQRLLALAFSGELTAGWRKLNDKTDNWQEALLSDLATVGTGATPKRGTPAFYDGGTIPWVTSGVVNEDVVNSADEMITETAIKETNCKVFPAGTLIVAMYGEGKTRGKVAVLGIDAATNQALAAIQLTSDLVSSRFVFWFFKSNYLELREQAAGGVQPNLSIGLIKQLTIPIPSTEEQTEIVRCIKSAFDWLDRMAANYAAAARLLPKLDAAILAKAFQGKLVSQDPNDEPAARLLERIMAEREAAPREKHGRKSRDSASSKDLKAMAKNLEQVLTEAGDWISAQDAFQQCGIGGAATTEEIENIYAELRKLDKAGKLEAEPVNDDQGRKLHDRLRLKVA